MPAHISVSEDIQKCSESFCIFVMKQVPGTKTVSALNFEKFELKSSVVVVLHHSKSNRVIMLR